MDRPDIDTAMILAAGLGTRMRPLTETTPKPLIRVGGKPLIDYAFEAAREAGVSRFVVNVHHLADQIVDHVAGWNCSSVTISDETGGLLDSGGGVVRALPHIGSRPFVILNADTFWFDAPDAAPNLGAMIEEFDPQTTDILMMLVRPDDAIGHETRDPARKGDFTMDGDGRLRRYAAGDADPLIYAGALVVHPRIFDGAPETPFSLNRCFDAALAADRLRGFEMRGQWVTVGTPGAIAVAEAALARHRPSLSRSA